MSDNLAGRAPLAPEEVAKSLYLQQVEQATDMRPFLAEMERVMKSSSSDSDDDDSDSEDEVMHARKAKGDRLVNGVMTTREERRKDRARAFNFTNVGKEREWLRNVLLNSSGSSEDESTPEGKNRRINLILRQRRLELKYAKRFRDKKTKRNYMYYSAGLLSTVDRYVHPERANKLPQPATRGRRGRPPSDRGGRSERRARGERKTRGPYKPRKGRVKDPPAVASTSVDTTMQDGFLDWEEQLRTIKVEEDEPFAFNASTSDRQPGVRGRKRLSEQNTPEALTALRRRHWQLVVKKDLGKVQRARANTHKEAILQRKRLSTACTKHWRNLASQSQKNMKETVWRCKRLSREMQTYWKRYDRAEKDARRRMEKEAEEQRKMDVEIMEAKRQRRKLNFLITQTELYAHFMQRKNHSVDNRSEQILKHLDEDFDPRFASIDTYDSEAVKAQAARNAREAFRAERARTQHFDSLAGVGDIEVEGEVEIEAVVEEPRTGEHDQPSIFRGTLKGYQLKGMNWLANLYDQGISGILADEMGLGKTVQCIAFLCHVAEKLGVWGPFLVVSPASTLHNWQQEMERFAPDFKVVPYWGSPSERKILRQFWERRDLHTAQAAFHVCITSYQIVVSDMKYLNRVSWQYMILDEAQAIKSSNSMRWKQLLGFSCRNRLLLSGTPIQNSMAELWALLHFIMPTLFDSHEEFNEWFSKDIESHAENKTTMDEKHLSRLHMILKPFMLRRVKKDVENELSDKIEIMVHCPLTIRQKLLYIALKQKIKIEELLHYSIGAETGHNTDKNFTSNLMNLVMQFRKVCNHPELFERRDVRSPFSMQVDDYHMPKLIAEDGILLRSIPSKRHLLYNKLCVLTPDYVHGSLKGKRKGGLFSFTRFINLSPMELHRVMMCGWLYAIHHIEESLERYDRLRHRQFWWFKHSSSKGRKRYSRQYERARCRDMLLICPDGDVLKQRKEDGLMWRELLFTDPLWINGGPFYTFADLTLHYMPETMEHRVMRAKHLQAADGQIWVHHNDQPSTSSAFIEDITPVKLPIEEFPHVEKDAVVFPMMPTPLPQFLYAAQPKASAHTRAPFAVSRAFAYHVTRHQHAECADGSRTLSRLVDNARPATGWAAVQVPDKNQLVSDAGKLTVLDSLLKRLKERGHRVLIYSQMTKMIDLLEEYMWHRKHKYMRLDGSSKISARRDMVADFQARTDIFVFLLSTRAGGLGINLTAADTVIFYDSDWNPTVDQQAMDRAHRLGQTKQVTVYRLICQGTIEERIMERAREKSEIQRMVISGGNFKVDSLKPKEVVSLLLDDEEIELKYRQKSEEKKREERERKRMSALPAQPAAVSTPESKRSPDSASDPTSPLRIDDDDDNIIVDAPVAATTFSPAVVNNSWGVKRGVRGARRGRPRGARHTMTRRLPEPIVDNASAVAAGALLVDSELPLDSPPVEAVRGRRGRGRPRSAAPRAPPARRPRRARDPLLVPLAPPPE